MLKPFRALAASALLALVLPAAALAQQQPQQPLQPQRPDPGEILHSLNFRAGSIGLGDNLANLSLNDDFRYLNNPDTQTFLTKLWGNPPGAGRNALGMLVPTKVNPLSHDAWAVVVTYEADGYVSDSDAAGIDYDALMRDMQKSTAEASQRRVAQGQESIELLGWARKPYYDPVAKKLYWAKRLRFGNDTEETLNYEIRILGRRGVLDLNVVGPMSALASIDRRAEDVLAQVQFNKGNTYAEFDPGVDKAAAYGVAGLIAGGVLAKAGFFKGLLVLLLASKKLLGVGLVVLFGGLWGAIKRFFGRGPTA